MRSTTRTAIRVLQNTSRPVTRVLVSSSVRSPTPTASTSTRLFATSPFLSSSPDPKPAEPISSEARCWSCNVHLPLSPPIHCPSCASIQPVQPSPNLFNVLALDATFEVDAARLKKEFLLRSKAVHPDGYKGKGEIEYQLAQAQSALVNRAYETLKSPLARAQYLLSLSSVEVQETDAMSDQSLLMDILEAREALEEADTEQDVDALRSENKVRSDECIASLAEAFDRKDLVKAKELCIELRYWYQVDEAARNGGIELLH